MSKSLKILEEINGLLGLALAPTPALPRWTSGRWGREASLATQLKQEIRGRCDQERCSKLDELVRGLTTDKADPYFGFVRDLSEILFLKREERSEYVNHREAYEPFVISKILLEYAVKSRRIDEVITSLTKSFCSTKCDRLPEGCCVVLGYDLGLVPEKMMELQEIEARLNGWVPPKRENKCRFHGPRGCYLKLFKSPACIGFLCEPLQDDLHRRFEPSSVDDLMERLPAFRNSDIDRAKVFDAMDDLVEYGIRLKADEG